MAAPRRLLAEIAARYRFEPNLDDIYVEGAGDKRLLSRALKDSGIERPIYEIDTVEIDDAVLRKHGLTRGNKGEVLALCYELNLKPKTKIRFLVDRDSEDYLTASRRAPGLVVTTHCDLYGVFLDIDGVERLLMDLGRIKCVSWVGLFKSIESVVREIFSLRLAISSRKVRFKVAQIHKSLSFNNESISINLEDLASRSAGANKMSVECADLVLSSVGWSARLSKFDARMAGRSHDYFNVLSWVIKKFGGNSRIADEIENVVLLLAPLKSSELARLVR